MDGKIYGLDVNDAMASLPALDRDFARRLLLVAEPAYVMAVWAREETSND